MKVVLVEPQIPPNTGNIARLCVATGSPLHLVGRLGFELTDRSLKRAGLDYWDALELNLEPSVEDFFQSVAPHSIHLFSSKAKRSYVEADFAFDDFLIFGSETHGLPSPILDIFPDRVWTIPMFSSKVRNLNLSSAVAIVLYEALRQNDRLKR